MTLDELKALDHIAFVARLGHVFEHAPWVADRAFTAAPFASVDGLHRAMVRVVEAASEAEQLRLLSAHPDLAGKAARAKTLTADSTAEQAGAGLDQLSDAEYARFHRMNTAYRHKFGFPFVIAVKGHGKDGILAAFEARLPNDRPTERATALDEVGRIARFRLGALLEEE